VHARKEAQLIYDNSTIHNDILDKAGQLNDSRYQQKTTAERKTIAGTRNSDVLRVIVLSLFHFSFWSRVADISLDNLQVNQ